MMEQRGLAPSTSEWFLIASQGDMVVRIRPGMLLGETLAGEVTFFNPSCAQLELDIAFDGSAVLSAVNNYELESAGGARSRCESLERHRRAEIRLPHNVLQLDTDFANPVSADDTVRIRIVPVKRHIEQSELGRYSEALPDEPADTTVAAPPPRPAERTRVRRQPTLDPLMAASIGLAAIGLALLYPVLRDGRMSQSPATVDAVPAVQTGPVQAADLASESPARDSEAELTTIRVPPLPLRLLELPASETTEAAALQQVPERAGESLPDPAFVAELEEIGETARVLTEALVQRRDLLAADLALAQGRLTSPPESSAYTLFNRVLARDPESPEARSGLQSVRQRLINRSLAQLAGGQLGDARSSLQAAADAGADPELVTDLHAEIDYRQRLTDAQNQ